MFLSPVILHDILYNKQPNVYESPEGKKLFVRIYRIPSLNYRPLTNAFSLQTFCPGVDALYLSMVFC